MSDQSIKYTEDKYGFTYGCAQVTRLYSEKLPLEKRIPEAEAVRRRAEGRIAAAHVRKDGWPTVDVDDRGLSTRMAGRRYDDPGMIMVFKPQIPEMIGRAILEVEGL